MYQMVRTNFFYYFYSVMHTIACYFLLFCYLEGIILRCYLITLSLAEILSKDCIKHDSHKDRR